MTDVAYTGAVALAAVFAWAGVAKLRQPLATAATFRELGLPSPRVLARGVPVVEVTLAPALVAAPRAGGLLALVLLAAFTGLLTSRLRRGETVACGCFGSARTAVLSAADLVRNGLLALAAAGAVTVPAALVPALPGVIAGTTAFALGGLALGLADVRVRTGRLLDNRLPADPEGLA